MSQLASTFIDAYLNGLRLANICNTIYLRAFEKAVEEEREDAIEATMGGGAKGTISPNMLESTYNKWLKNVDEGLEVELKSEHFTSLLSRYTQLLLGLRSSFRQAGYPIDYFDRLFDWYVRSTMVFSLIPKESHLAPFEVIYKKGKMRLLHYHRHDHSTSKSAKKQQPLLIIYAPINTFHIQDLNPRRSVIRDLLASTGLDIYLIDWGYPDWDDNLLSLEDYLGYVKDAVEVVKDQSKENKISILGYCWGGIIALIHASLHPEQVRNLVLMAAPLDSSNDNTILAKWAKTIDLDQMMDELGHMDGQVLDLAFLMRNPPRYGLDKYLKLFQRSQDREFMDTFVDVERWLYDTPPIPGVLHRQIINDCYRNNLLISSSIEITSKEGDSKKQRVDLGKISMPVLTVIAEKDDLVSPASSTAINDRNTSKDKMILKNPGGHVALCISNYAHKKLWPEVAEWLISR